MKDQIASQGLCATQTLLNSHQDEKCSAHPATTLSVDWGSFPVWCFYHCSQGITIGTVISKRLWWWGFSMSVYFPILLGLRSF